MDSSTSKLISKLVQLTFSHLSVPSKKNLSDLIIAFFYNRSFTLWEIASCLEGETTTKHKHKRLLYFLDQFTLDTAFWKSYLLLIFSLPGLRLKSRKVLTLAIDATTLKADFWMLAVSISFKGRSIPIYLKSWKGVHESYNYWERVGQTLKEIKELLPSGYRYELVADRGFQGENMLEFLRDIEWEYVVRINGCWLVKTGQNQTFIQLNLFTDGWYEHVTLGKQAQIHPVNLAVSSYETKEKERSTWFLMTNVTDATHAIESYKRRFWIEESFKDLKSKLKWETYTKKIPTQDRLTKCIVVSCLSYAIQTSLGTQIELSKSEHRKTSIFNRFRQAFVRTNKKLEAVILKFIAMIHTYVRRSKFAFS